MTGAEHWFESQPDWFKTAVFYELHTRAFFDSSDDGSGDFRGPAPEARLPPVARHRLHLAPAVLPLAAPGRRLRRRRLPHGEPRVRHGRRVRVVRRGRARARDARDQRLRHEPHLERAPVVPGVAPGRRQPEGRLVRLVGHGAPLRGRADHLRRLGAVELDVRPGARCLLLAPLLPPPARPQLREPGRRRRDDRRRSASGSTSGLDGFRLDAVPYLFEEEGTNCENLPPTHAFLKRVRAEIDARVHRPGAARRGEPVARGRRRLLRRRGRVPHGVPLPRDAAHVHGAPARGGAADGRDPRPHAADPGPLPVGAVPAEPRRADARDGDGRGAGLHVRGVREGPADEAQPRHPPPARAAPRRRARRDRADARDPVLAPGLAGAVLRGRDRDGRQRLPRRPGRGADADAVDGRPERRLLARRLRAALPPAADGPGVRLPGGQRRGPAPLADVAAALAPALRRAAQGAPGFRPRHVRGARDVELARVRPRPPARERHRALRPQPRALGPGGRARPRRASRVGPRSR